ncbi:hypothetical protein SLS62_000906 [Diatrype stigma]|uniref:Uncharacterized protein n=1 Tax=Diatrype stigma TaxID=117547 RepID=A0AAN9YX02_9PEZI
MVYGLRMPKGQKWGVVLIESNLLVISGSIPTLRCFLNHAVPKIMGGPKHSLKPNPNTPRTQVYTPAEKRRNQHYTRFGGSDKEEDELELQTLGQMGAKKHGHRGGGSTTVVRGVGTTTIEAGRPSTNSNWDDRPGGEDDDSERAIVQTTTVTVQHE